MKDRQKRESLDQIREDHVARYEFAVSRIKKQSRVLDAACGIGYGSKLIEDAGNRVVGVDISQEALDYAKAHYAGPGYLLGDILDKPWIGMFDALVSFETIEHLPEPDKALRLFRDSVDGMFICSVPNEAVFPFNAEKFENDEYPHLRHYLPEELDETLKKADFTVLERHSQKDRHGEFIEGTEGKFLVYVCR